MKVRYVFEYSEKKSIFKKFEGKTFKSVKSAADSMKPGESIILRKVEVLSSGFEVLACYVEVKNTKTSYFTRNIFGDY